MKVKRSPPVLVPYDRNRSPIGWYFGSYLLRFVELNLRGNDSLTRRFLSWENTVLVKAKDLDHAFDKVTKIGRGHTAPYKGGPDGVPVRWIFEGITELLPVYEEIEDGSEIMWTERKPRTLRKLRTMVRSKAALRQS
jgi:hypothetical protein